MIGALLATPLADRPKGARPSIKDKPAKELQAAPSRSILWPDFLAIPAGSAVAATTEPSSASQRVMAIPQHPSGRLWTATSSPAGLSVPTKDQRLRYLTERKIVSTKEVQ